MPPNYELYRAAEQLFHSAFAEALGSIGMSEVYVPGRNPLPAERYGLVPLLPLPGWHYPSSMRSLDLRYQLPDGIRTCFDSKDSSPQNQRPALRSGAGVGLTCTYGNENVLIAVSSAAVVIDRDGVDPRLEVRQLQGSIRTHLHPEYEEGIDGIRFGRTFLRTHESMAPFFRLGIVGLRIPQSANPEVRNRVTKLYTEAATGEGYAQAASDLWLKTI